MKEFTIASDTMANIACTLVLVETRCQGSVTIFLSWPEPTSCVSRLVIQPTYFVAKSAGTPAACAVLTALRHSSVYSSGRSYCDPSAPM